MKLTARNDQVTIKSQSKHDFAGGKYGYWRKSARWEKSKVRALLFKNVNSKMKIWVTWANFKMWAC